MMDLIPAAIVVVAFGALGLLAIGSAWLVAVLESDGHGRDDRDTLDSRTETDGGTVLEATDEDVQEAISRTEATHE